MANALPVAAVTAGKCIVSVQGLPNTSSVNTNQIIRWMIAAAPTLGPPPCANEPVENELAFGYRNDSVGILSRLLIRSHGLRAPPMV